MGVFPSICRCFRGTEYEPLNKSFNLEGSIGADRARIRSIDEEDAALMADPTIMAVLEDEGLADIELDDEELNNYIQGLNPS